MKRDFTATTYVVHEGKVLLVFHRKLQKWLPPGGHIQNNETPEETVVREVKEETGLDVEIVGEKQPKMTGVVESLFRPEFIQLEDIEQDGDIHQHIDLFYLTIPKTHDISISKESEDIRWFTPEEMEKEGIAKDIIYNAKILIEKVEKL